MIKSKLFIVALVSLFCFRVSAQQSVFVSNYYNEALVADVYKAFHQVNNFNFSTSDSLIKQIKKKYKPNSLTYILQANHYWWYMVAGEYNPDNKKKFNACLDSALLYLPKNKGDRQSMLNTYFHINIYCYKARVEVIEHNYFSMFSHLSTCMHYLKKSFGNEKQFEWFNLTSGLYNYLIEWGKQKHPVMSPFVLVYPKGNMKLGFEQLLAACNSSDVLLKNEANYFMLNVYYETRTDWDNADKYAQTIIKNYPQNVYYKFLYFKLLLRANKKAEALKQLEIINYVCNTHKQLNAKQKKRFLNDAQEELVRYYERAAK